MFHLTPWSKKHLPVKHEEAGVYSLQREMNRMFDEFFQGMRWDMPGEFYPDTFDRGFGEVSTHLDMSETDKALLLKIDVPGMTEKDIDISVNQNRLTISGEKKQEKEQTEKGWYRMERQYGSFSRTIPLPCEVESEKAEAVYKNGVLSITLPKVNPQESQGKKVTVKAAQS
ncbi:MAG: Hsp20/alpha crystallin family protein [Cyanobacteria bacterium SZAS LIN-3]|nr:Hsp20/alpha crystallin family protein [Cyanobacteria bacterium SZAS LIN-3]MBS2008011.1 Hsp20/alpha crystallin family protein [Cyanobacteria bacterium SZAS TMP-1]